MKISILLPIYNAKDYLNEAIESVLGSSEEDFELLAIDDGSTDGSCEILKFFEKKDPRVKLLFQDHGGIVKALNYGLKEAKGKYIARMDADDISYPDRFKIQIEYLEKHPKVMAVGSWVRFIDQENRPFFIYQTPTAFEEITEYLWQSNGGALIHPVVMFRRSALEALNGYREEYRSIEDLDLYLRLLKLGELHNIPQVLLDYRQHFKSVNYSSNHEDRKKLHEKLMQEHCEAAHKPLPELKRAVHEKTREEVYAQWANWALEDNFYKTFWIYTLTIISLNPFSFKNWRQSFCLLFLFWIRMIKKIKNKSMRFS